MNFFSTFKRSVAQPKAYDQLLSKPASFSWKYFLTLHAWIVLVFCILLGAQLSIFSIEPILQKAASVYPEELEVTYHKEGRISINQELPYAIPMPEFDIDETPDEDLPANMIVFDSAEDPAEASIFDYDTFLLVTERTVQGIRHDGTSPEQANTYRIPEGEEDFTLTKGKIDSGVSAIVNHWFIRYKVYVPILMLLIFPFFFGVLVLIRLGMLAFFTFFTWLLALIFFRARTFGYGMLFRVSMHSITLILLISYVADLLGIFFFRGFVYFFAFLLWTMYIVSFMHGSKGHPAPATHARHPRPPVKKPRAKKKVTKKKAS